MTAGSEIAAQVKDAYAQAGQATGNGPLVGTISRKGENTGSDYAPAFGEPTDYDFTVLIGSYSARERDGTNILATDIKIKASVGGIDPLPDDKMTINGKDFEIISVMPLKPGGEVLGWTIQGRE